MGDLNISGMSESDLARMGAEAEKLGISLESYVRLKLNAGTDRGATARAIRSRQSQSAKRSSVEIIREERNFP